MSDQINSNNLKKLVEHRDTILLAEIGTLIHDLGKLSEEFVRQMSMNEGIYRDLFSHELILGRSFLFIRDRDVVPIRGDLHLKLADIKKLVKVIRNPRDRNEVRAVASNILGTSLSRRQAEELGKVIEIYKKEEYASQAVKINKDLVEILNELKFKINDEELRLADLIACHGGSDIYWMYDKKSEGLLDLFKRAADTIDSGIDKGAVINVNKQSESHTYISTPFGYESRKIDTNSRQLRQYREKFIQKLETILKKIGSNSGTLFAEDWANLRDELLRSAKECFIHALGETRRSANDVTLWDHSYSTASLYKTALVDIILSGQWKDPTKVKWRLLSIRFNGFDYITKSNKVGDILGRKKRIELALDLVKDLIEVHIPLGNEIYRDENGSVFLIPDGFDREALSGIIGDGNPPILLVKDEKIVRDRTKLTEFLADGFKPDIAIFIESTDTVKSAIEKIFNEVTYSELKPIIRVSEASRGAVNLGKELEENKVLFNQPFAENIKRKWNTKAPICKVCGLKPCERENKGYSDLCEDCKRVRESRARVWYNERIRHKSTIWIDEVCDKNGRVGVIVGAFDLDDWLNGMWLNTTFTKTLEDLKKENLEIFHEICCWENLINAVKEALDKNLPENEISFKKSDGSSIKVRELFKALAPEAYRKNPETKEWPKAKDFFDAIIKSREEDVVKWAYYDEHTNIDDLSSDQKARLLILALFRKNPSFARIRRIWETTKGFWDQIETLIQNKLGEKERTKIIFRKIPPVIDLKPFMAYTLKIKGISIPVLYIDRGEFLIIETWDILKTSGINEEFLEENLRKGNFELWQPSEYKEESKKMYPKSDVGMPEFVCITKDSKYYPYITILKEPTIFVVLIPLQRSLDIIKLIKKEYEIQFSKVQSRLPIKLGLIAFKRKYPLYVVLDTVKRFLNEEIEEKVFEVKRLDRISAEENCKKFDGRLGNYAKIIELSKNYRRFTAYISYSTGDPSFEDAFYPYVIIKDSSGLETLIYNKYSKKYDINNLIKIKHVSRVLKGEEIFFDPSLFDFVFLDSNIRRFDVGKTRKHWLFTESKNRPKPYLLWDIDNFERLRELLIDKLELTTSQIINLYELLIGKLEEWGVREVPVELKDNENNKKMYKLFEEFVENAVISIPLRLKVVDSSESSKGRISREDFEFFKNAILNGLFFDFVDLWYTILKFKFEDGEVRRNGRKCNI